MAQSVSVMVGAEDRARLAAIVGDRSRPFKHVQRARIVLHSAEQAVGGGGGAPFPCELPGGVALAASLYRGRG